MVSRSERRLLRRGAGRRNGWPAAGFPAALLLTAAALLLTASLSGPPAWGQAQPAAALAAAPESHLEAEGRADPGMASRPALAEAEKQLAGGEPQVAESRYRSVLLEAWHVLGLLAVAEGDLPAARDAFERATVSAAVGVLAPRIDLALVQHRLGETADALQRLRALTRQFRPQALAWRKLIYTLVADGRQGEAEEQIADLRLVLPAAAAELEASLAGLEDTEQAREARRPQIDLSRLGHGAEQRQRLRSAATAAIDQAHLGLTAARAQASSEASGLEALLASISLAPRQDDSSQGQVPEPLVDAARAIKKAQPRQAVGFLRRAQKQGYGSLAVSKLLTIVNSAIGGGVRARLELAQIAGLGGPKAALELLAEARHRAPSSEQVLAAHARIAMSAGLTAQALQTLEPLAGIFSDVAEYSYLLGTARARLGSMTDAVEALRRSVELAPEEVTYRAAFAQALNHEKRFDEAEAELIRVLEETPEDLASVAALAQAEEGLGKLESAEQHAREVLRRTPEHAAAHLVIGMVRMKQERYAEAREALEKTLSADSGAIKAHYQLSLACMRLGDRQSAKRHLDLYNAALENTEGKATLLHLESSRPPAGKGNLR